MCVTDAAVYTALFWYEFNVRPLVCLCHFSSSHVLFMSGEVTCEDKAECANMPTSGCESEMVGPEMEMEMEMGGPEGPGATGGPAGDPQMMNVCPKKCGMC